MTQGPAALRIRRAEAPAPALRAGLLATGAAVVAAACASARAPGPPALPSSACLIGQVDVEAGVGAAEGHDRPFVVGIGGPVDPSRAPLPGTPAEQLVFAQMYRTLVEVDCEGGVLPGLAESWSASEGGRQWNFTLRADVSDWTGAPVTAETVSRAWLGANERILGAGSELGPTSPRLVSIQAADARTLRVELTQPVELGSFAHARWSVWSPPSGSPWPTGTGPFRPDPDAVRPGPRPAPLSALILTGPVTLEFREIRGDARNALEAGVDVLVTHDPTVIDYARASAGFLATPGPWNRTYVLLAPAGRQSRGAGSSTPPADTDAQALAPVVRVMLPPESARAALARDAVRTVARPAPDPASDARCGPGIGFAPVRATTSRSRTVVFPVGDPVARGLAERLIALARESGRLENGWVADALPTSGRPAPLTAAGLAGAPFDAALRAGREAAYVIPMEVGPRAGPCEAVATALSLAPWLADPPRNGEGPALLPLIETRSVFVARRGVHGLFADGAGALRFERTRWGTPGPVP